MKIPKRLVVTSTQSGVGLSTIFKGIVVALRETGISIKVDIVGDSLIKATHYRRITGKISQNLSPKLLSNQQIINSYKSSLNNCDVHCLLCEDINHLGSLAKDLDTVLFLVFDSRKDNLNDVFSKIEAVNSYDQVGLIANFINDDFQYPEHEKFKLIGTIPDFTNDDFVGKSSLTMNRNPSLLTRNQLLRLKTLVNKYINFKDFRSIYEQSREIEVNKRIKLDSKFRVAFADDTAFNLSVQDNINSLYMNGASIVPFSPLADDKLPDNIDFIYFPNTYIDIYLDEVLKNKSLIRDLQKKIDSGTFAYFEGDSIAYACKNLIMNNQKHKMCGFVDIDIELEEVPIWGKYSSMKLKARSDCFFIDNNDECSAYVTDSLKAEESSYRVFDITNTAVGGICERSNVFCTSSLLHWGSNGNIAKNIILNCK